MCELGATHMKTIPLLIVLQCFIGLIGSTGQTVGDHADHVSTNIIFKLGGSGGAKLGSEERGDLVMHGADSRYGKEFQSDVVDLQGNWRVVTNWSQLSVRTYATNFAIGNALPIVVLWRNCGPATMSFPLGSDVNYPLTLVLKRGDEYLKPQMPAFEPEKLVSGWAQAIPAQSQYRYTLHLDNIYKLDRPGNYELYAERWTTDGKYWDPPMTNCPRALARSGTLKFTLAPRNESRR